MSTKYETRHIYYINKKRKIMRNTNVNTPYDDVFRTLLTDCSSLIIPVVNEIFHENYTGEETVT